MKEDEAWLAVFISLKLVIVLTSLTVSLGSVALSGLVVLSWPDLTCPILERFVLNDGTCRQFFNVSHDESRRSWLIY